MQVFYKNIYPQKFNKLKFAFLNLISKKALFIKYSLYVSNIVCYYFINSRLFLSQKFGYEDLNY